MGSRAGGVGLVGAGGGGAGAGGQIGVRVVKSVSGVVICISHVGVSVGCIIGVAFAECFVPRVGVPRVVIVR